MDETNKLLSSAGYQFIRNDNFDLIICYFIEKEIYDIDLINSYLDSYTGTVLD